MEAHSVFKTVLHKQAFVFLEILFVCSVSGDFFTHQGDVSVRAGDAIILKTSVPENESPELLVAAIHLFKEGSTTGELVSEVLHPLTVEAHCSRQLSEERTCFASSQLVNKTHRSLYKLFNANECDEGKYFYSLKVFPPSPLKYHFSIKVDTLPTSGKLVPSTGFPSTVSNSDTVVFGCQLTDDDVGDLHWIKVGEPSGTVYPLGTSELERERVDSVKHEDTCLFTFTKWANITITGGPNALTFRFDCVMSSRAFCSTPRLTVLPLIPTKSIPTTERDVVIVGVVICSFFALLAVAAITFALKGRDLTVQSVVSTLMNWFTPSTSLSGTHKKSRTDSEFRRSSKKNSEESGLYETLYGGPPYKPPKSKLRKDKRKKASDGEPLIRKRYKSDRSRNKTAKNSKTAPDMDDDLVISPRNRSLALCNVRKALKMNRKSKNEKQRKKTGSSRRASNVDEAEEIEDDGEERVAEGFGKKKLRRRSRVKKESQRLSFVGQQVSRKSKNDTIDSTAKRRVRKRSKKRSVNVPARGSDAVLQPDSQRQSQMWPTGSDEVSNAEGELEED